VQEGIKQTPVVWRDESLDLLGRLLALTAGLDAHDGIGDRVECGAPKDLEGDPVAFESLAASGEGLVDNVPGTRAGAGTGRTARS
jgi:hypothetical protein